MADTDFLSLSPAGRKYGRHQDNPYSPARTLRALHAPAGLVLPNEAMELCPYKGPTRNQLSTGSCTGQSGAEKVDLDYRQFQDWPDRSIPASSFEASASFVYKRNLISDGNLGQDVGSSMHQTAVTLSQYGAATNAVEPYRDHDYRSDLTPAQYASANYYRMRPYHYLPDLPAMLSCLAPSPAGPGHSFIFGITVFESFESDWKEPGFMPMPKSGEQILGGHAQHVIAFKLDLKFPDGNVGGVLVQNSWGDKDVWTSGIDAPGHSDGGCYWMPLAFIRAGYANDAWINHTGPIWK